MKQGAMKKSKRVREPDSLATQNKKIVRANDPSESVIFLLICAAAKGARKFSFTGSRPSSGVKVIPNLRQSTVSFSNSSVVSSALAFMNEQRFTAAAFRDSEINIEGIQIFGEFATVNMTYYV